MNRDYLGSANREMSVSPWKEDAGKYDILVAALGFEARATFAAKRLSESATHKLAFAFAHRRLLNFDANRAWFERANFESIEAEDGPDFEVKAERALGGAIDAQSGRALRICVDISSFSRQRLAFLVAYLLRRVDRALDVDFVYSPSTFAPPRHDDPPISFCAPVTNDYGGWPVGPELPTLLVCGLGYEPDRALGVAEYLDAAGSWLFFPSGPVKQFEPEVKKANAELLDGFPPERVIHYDLAKPFNTFVLLESLVSGLIDRAQPILVPLGPKPFALASLLVGIAHGPRVSVWRISAGQEENPIDREPEGIVVGLSVSVVPEGLGPQPDTNPR